MFSNNSSSFSISGKAQCIDALLGETERSQFLVGTTTLTQPNQLQVLDYDSSANELTLKHVYAHPTQVRELTPSPTDKQLVWTCGKQSQAPATTAKLWRMQGLDDLSDTSADGQTPAPKELTPVTELPDSAGDVRKLVWQLTDENDGAVVASAHGDMTVRTWSLENDCVGAKDKFQASAAITSVRWDPHHANSIVMAAGNVIRTWDCRQAGREGAMVVEDAHMNRVLDVDFNPNKPHCVASGGDDGKLKFWDLRHAKKPLLSLSHTHWVQCVRYNRFHDQLLLSSSSDCTVALWRVSSISSAPIVELDEQADIMGDSAGSDVVDTKIKSYEEHEDSVYSLAWGATDSWLFASVSYDGRVALNAVPSTEKYKILL